MLKPPHPAGRLVLIQGAAAGRHHWGARFLHALSTRCEVFSYEQPRTWTDDVGQHLTIDDLADDLAIVLDSRNWDSASVFGVSLGGVIAQEFALRHPGRLEQLILGGTNTGGAGDVIDAVAELDLMSIVVHGDRDATSRNMFRAGVKNPATVAPEAWQEYRVAEVCSPFSPHATVLQMQAYARHSTASRLAQLDVPTLVLHGDSDRVIALEEGIALTRLIPRAQLSVLSAGHLFWLEQPAMTATLVADFCGTAARRNDQVP